MKTLILLLLANLCLACAMAGIQGCMPPDPLMPTRDYVTVEDQNQVVNLLSTDDLLVDVSASISGWKMVCDAFSASDTSELVLDVGYIKVGADLIGTDPVRFQLAERKN